MICQINAVTLYLRDLKSTEFSLNLTCTNDKRNLFFENIVFKPLIDENFDDSFYAGV